MTQQRGLRKKRRSEALDQLPAREGRIPELRAPMPEQKGRELLTGLPAQQKTKGPRHTGGRTRRGTVFQVNGADETGRPENVRKLNMHSTLDPDLRKGHHSCYQNTPRDSRCCRGPVQKGRYNQKTSRAEANYRLRQYETQSGGSLEGEATEKQQRKMTKSRGQKGGCWLKMRKNQP